MSPPTGARALTDSDRVAEQTAYYAADAAAAKKAHDIRIIDIGDLLGITDFFVLLSAGNERQLGTVVEEIEQRLKERDLRPVRREGTKDSGWVVIDYGDVVVHAFSEEQRAFYGLERLWADAPELEYSETERAGVEA